MFEIKLQIPDDMHDIIQRIRIKRIPFNRDPERLKRLGMVEDNSTPPDSYQIELFADTMLRLLHLGIEQWGRIQAELTEGVK